MPSTTATSSDPRRRLLAWLNREPDRWLTVAAVLGFVVLCLAGITTSSIGMLRQDPALSNGTYGSLQAIRSDEYNAFSPIMLSAISTNGKPTLGYMGAEAQLVQRYSDGGLATSLTYFDTTLSVWLGQLNPAVGFAFHWWLPTLVLIVSMPIWVRQLGGSRIAGWLASLLVVMSPANAWWSLAVSQQTAFTLAGGVLMIASVDSFQARRTVRGVLQAVAAGVLIAGLPSNYFIFAFILGGGVLLVSTVRALSAQASWRARLLGVGIAGMTAAIVGAATILDGLAGLKALMSTAYPGSRRSTAVAESWGLTYGAPFLGNIESLATPGSNPSELSSALTVTFLIAGIAVMVHRPTLRALRAHAGVVALWAYGLAMLLWGSVNLGPIGMNIPFFNLMQPHRVVQMVGVFGTVAMAVALSRLPARTSTWFALAGAGVATAVTALAGLAVRSTALPDISRVDLVLGCLGVALGSFVLLRWPRRLWPAVLVVLLAALLVYRAQPLQVGLGDVQESSTARYLQQAGRQARADGTLWASDQAAFDTVMAANGVQSISGMMRSGPDAGKWQYLTPTAESHIWNRGGGFVRIVWAAGQAPTASVAPPAPDVTVLTTDPCLLARMVPELRHVASTKPLTASCLTEETVLTWAGEAIHVYRVSQP